MIKFHLLLFVAIFSVSTNYAQLHLPSIFGDKMVLQQSTNVKIWGEADKKALVTITPSWSGQKYRVIADADGQWSTRIATPKADYVEYTLTIKSGKEEVVFLDVLLGEVWLCSGQSNMEMTMKGYNTNPVIGAPEALMNVNDKLRLFDIKKAYKLEPQMDCTGEWEFADSESVLKFSAAAYFFGAQLQKSLDVPIALITSSWGGANIISFMSEESLDAFPEIRLADNIKDEKQIKGPPQRHPKILFNAMINPIVGYNIAGCLWYQGESDRNEPEQYRKLFASMLSDWRAKWECGNFSFHLAEIAPFGYAGKFKNAAFMREAQLMTTLESDSCYMISLIDAGEEFDIHPASKALVGFRFAQSVLEYKYGFKGVISNGPRYKSMTIKGNKATIVFDKKNITSRKKSILGFEVAGQDKIFYPANAVVQQGRIVASSDKVSNPVAVRFLFHSWVEKGNLFGLCGNPVTSFRTDDWDM